MENLFHQFPRVVQKEKKQSKIKDQWNNTQCVSLKLSRLSVTWPSTVVRLINALRMLQRYNQFRRRSRFCREAIALHNPIKGHAYKPPPSNTLEDNNPTSSLCVCAALNCAGAKLDWNIIVWRPCICSFRV